MSQYKLPVYSIEELEAANSYPPLENGRYKFRVLSCEQHTSDAGNHVEKVALEVHHKPGRTMRCFHNFSFTNPGEKSHLWLVGNAKRFLDCIGVEYNEDAFARIVNREGYADFYVKEYKSKKDGKQKEKFAVPNECFLSPDDLKNPPASAPTPATPKAVERFDDDIPF